MFIALMWVVLACYCGWLGLVGRDLSRVRSVRIWLFCMWRGICFYGLRLRMRFHLLELGRLCLSVIECPWGPFILVCWNVIVPWFDEALFCWDGRNMWICRCYGWYGLMFLLTLGRIGPGLALVFVYLVWWLACLRNICSMSIRYLLCVVD